VSRLEFFSRPLVAFDPAKKEHRRYYHQFIEHRSWGWCPVRFICPDDTGMNLVTMIQRSLIEYYIQKEFAGQKEVQKRPKLVDNKTKR
jgi:hypothetical protein